MGLEIIAKYPNRKLYSYETRAYISLAEVLERYIAGRAFKVFTRQGSEFGPDITEKITFEAIVEHCQTDASFIQHVLDFKKNSQNKP